MRDEVIVPQSSLKWLTSQPDDVMSMGEAFSEIDQVAYMTGDSKHVTDDWSGWLVKHNINAVLEKIVVALNAELSYAFDTRFGTDEDNWTELNVHKTMGLVVAQASSRFIVGLPLCNSAISFMKALY